jgi:hypothetical protein
MLQEAAFEVRQEDMRGLLRRSVHGDNNELMKGTNHELCYNPGERQRMVKICCSRIVVLSRTAGSK